jgi:hypothetical protein
MPTPTEREKSQMYLQRYIPHLPAAGKVVIFDRSWYNRAGIERVMSFLHRRTGQPLSSDDAAGGEGHGRVWYHVAKYIGSMSAPKKTPVSSGSWCICRHSFHFLCGWESARRKACVTGAFGVVPHCCMTLWRLSGIFVTSMTRMSYLAAR